MIKISLITVTYNAEQVLKTTLDSVFKQEYPTIEHIIIDGASTDNTVAMAKDYMEKSFASDNGHEVRLLVEPDNGIYDAMNKGLSMATGDYICFLNAGDSLHNNDTIGSLVRNTCVDSYITEDGGKDRMPAVLYGNTDIVDDNGNFICHRRLSPPEHLTWMSFRDGMLVCHQAFYARTDIAKKTAFNTAYRFSADFDWCIRIMKEAENRRLPLIDSHIILVNYLKEGTTTKNHKASLKERFRIMATYYGLTTTYLRHAWFVMRAIIKR